ncbi:MAG: GNAT family N-acetyltransferase [Pseudonocardiaceae bacterium]
MPRQPDEIRSANNAVTYVSVLDGRVAGYYAIAVADVTSEAAPVPVAKGAPEQVPCLLLARLAVDQSMHGLGLGRGLLTDVLQRTVGRADAVGTRALLVHARDDAAAQFSLAQAGFLASPSDPLHLLLPVKDIVRSLG